SQVRYVAVDPADEIVRFDFQFSYQRLISVSFILASIDIIDQFVNRTARDSAKVNVLLIVPASMPFGNIVGNRKCCPPHLHAQGIPFFRWQLFEKLVSPLAKSPCTLIKLEVIQLITAIFHGL